MPQSKRAAMCACILHRSFVLMGAPRPICCSCHQTNPELLFGQGELWLNEVVAL